MIKNILVPVDGSEHSIKALKLAADLSEKYNALLTAIHVRTADYSAEFKHFAEVEYFVMDQDKLNEVSIDLGKILIRDVTTKSGVTRNFKKVVVMGEPAETISEYAQKHDIDTIVMGSRGLSDFKGLLLGSVSHKINHLVDCTCITVK